MKSRIYVLLFAIVSAIICLMQQTNQNSIEGFVPIRYTDDVPNPDMTDKRIKAAEYKTFVNRGKFRALTAPELLWGDGEDGVCSACSELEDQMADQAEIIASRNAKYDSLRLRNDDGQALETSAEARARYEAEAALNQTRAQQAVQANTFLGRPEVGTDYIRGDMRICVKKSEADHSYTSQQLESSQKPLVGYFMGEADRD